MVWNAQRQMRSEAEELLRLAQRHLREKEELNRKMLEMFRALSAKQHLELDIEELKGSMNVMQYMGGDADVQKKKIEIMTAELQKKTAELEIKNQELKSVEEYFG